MIAGKALKYEADDVDTDVIWPGKYTYVQLAPEEMVEHAMEHFDPEFPAKAREHAILVVGRNFGCGSSREQASECLKHAGIRAIVAKSFARIFYRNSLNLGLPVIECPEAVAAIESGSEVEVELEVGRLRVGDQEHAFAPYPPFVLELIRDGGLIPHLRKQVP